MFHDLYLRNQNNDPLLSQAQHQEGVNINWWHGDAAKSKQAAQEMVDGYGINNLGVAPCGHVASP